MQNERKDQKFTLLLVDFKESPEKVAAWVKDHGVTPMVLLDRDGAVTGRYKVTGTPTVIVIGRDGKMVARAVGPRPWNSGDARQLLDLLLKTP